MYQQQAQGQDPNAGADTSSANDDDDVIDADFEVKDE